MKIKKARWLFAALAIVMLVSMFAGLTGADNGITEADLAVMDLGTEGIMHIGSDTETKGDWKGIDNPVSSPIGRYGSCAYILPDPPRNRVEEVVGDFHAPVGFDIGDPNTYYLLGESPWDWTFSQILGLDYYKPDSPYFDEFWTAGGMEDFDYTLSGSYMEFDSRSLVDDSGLFTRAACWFAGSTGSPDELDIELQVPAGEYMLSLYLIDWDDVGREETVTVEVMANEKSESVDSFYDGVYVNFFVNLPSDATVNINVVKDVGANSVVSGLFLSDTDETAANAGEAEVRSLAPDTTTQGNWVGVYGDIGWVLSAFDVPETRVRYDWVSDYDRSDGIDYSVTGTQYAWNAETAFIDAIQYPVFEWAWASATDDRPSDPRAAYYPIKEQWRPAVWDDGGERCKPEHGYFDFNLHFPEGRYMLSLYTYDWERTRNSQEYQLFNANDMETVLASSVVSGEAFSEGVYESFVLEAGEGGRDMVVRIYNDQGHPVPNINVLLQGVFVDCLEAPTYDVCGYKFLAEDGGCTGTAYTGGWEISLKVFDEAEDDWVLFKQDELDNPVYTDAYGKYCFTDLPAGTYRIYEEVKDGYQQIEPEAGYYEVTVPTGQTVSDDGPFYNFCNEKKNCETAWATEVEDDEATSNENWDMLGTGNAWGWNIGALEIDDEIDFELWAAAGQNDLGNGVQVGEGRIEYDGEVVCVYFTLFDGFDFEDVHLWVGETNLPETRRGYTAAPGQFNFNDVEWDKDGNTYSVCLDVEDDEIGTYGGAIFVALHLEVCWFPSDLVVAE